MSPYRTLALFAALVALAAASSKTLTSYTASEDEFAVCAIDGQTRRPACFGSLGAALVEAPNTQLQSLTVGRTHACGLDQNSNGLCWGPQTAALSVPPHRKFAQVLACNAWTCTLDAAGEARCFGAQGPWLSVPHKLFRSLTCGDAFVCGIAFDGAAVCWGDDTYGVSSTAPKGAKFGAITSSPTHVCGTTMQEREVVCWGDSTDDKCNPPKGLTGVTSVSCAETYCCASDDNAVPVCWGSNIPEELGADRKARQRGLYSLTGETVAVGPEWACALKDSGERNCVGNFRFVLPRTIATNPCLHGDCMDGEACMDNCLCPPGYSPTDNNTECECTDSSCATCPSPEIVGLDGSCTTCGNGIRESTESCDASAGDTHCFTSNCTCAPGYLADGYGCRLNCYEFSSESVCEAYNASCSWCGQCVPGNMSCCDVVADETSCVNVGCTWCGIYEASPCATTCATKDQDCYNAFDSREKCDDTVGSDGKTCVMCGSKNCLNSYECTSAAPTMSATLQTPCELGWTDMVITIKTPGIPEFIKSQAVWLLKPSSSSSYLAPSVSGRTIPIASIGQSTLSSGLYVTKITLNATDFIDGDAWRVTFRTYIASLKMYTNSVTVGIDSSVCNPSCAQRSLFGQCLSHSCTWCGQTGCKDNQSACYPISLCGSQGITASWGPYTAHSPRWCSQEHANASSFRVAWLYEPTLSSELRLVSQCFALNIGTNSLYLSKTYSTFTLRLYNVAADGNPGNETTNTQFTLRHDSPGTFGHTLNQFIKGILLTGNTWFSLEWTNECPPIEFLLQPSARRSSSKVLTSVPSGGSTAVTWTPVPNVIAPTIVTTLCGNGVKNSDEDCDGSNWCTDSCTCMAGFKDDSSSAHNCEVEADPDYACNFYELTSRLTGEVLGSAISDVNASVCQDTCCVTAGCHAYTLHDGNCYLLKEPGKMEACTSGKCYSGIVSQCPSVFFADVVAYSANDTTDLITVTTDDAIACAQECCADADCVSWSYYSSPSVYAGQCQIAHSAGWIVQNVSDVVSGFMAHSCNDTDGCNSGSSYCSECSCMYGRVMQTDGSCACTSVNPHGLVAPPYLNVALDGNNIGISVYLPNTEPVRTQTSMEINSYSTSLTDTSACLFTGTLKVPVSSLPSSSACTTGIVGGSFRLTCSVTVRYTESVTLAQRKRDSISVDRNVTSTLKFHLAASASINVNATVFTLGTRSLWAIVSKSKISTVGSTIVTELELMTRAPSSSYIKQSSISFAANGAISGAQLLNVSSEYANTQVWRILFVINSTVCHLNSSDSVTMSYSVVHGSSVLPGSLLISLESTESLCSVTTDEVQKFSSTALTSGRENLTLGTSQFFLNTTIYEGIQLGLSFAEVAGSKIQADITKVILSGSAVKDASGQVEVDAATWGLATYTCPTSSNYSVCFHFNLLGEYLKDSEQVTIIATVSVSAVDLGRKRSLMPTAMFEARANAYSSVYLMRRLASSIAPAVAATTAAAVDAQKQIVVVYKTPVLAITLLVCTAFVSSTGIAAFVFYVMQRKSRVTA